MSELLFCGRRAAFAKTFDDELQKYLTESNAEWTVLERSAHYAVEAEWRSIFGQHFVGRRRRYRTGAKAEHEYSLGQHGKFRIVPFTSYVDGIQMADVPGHLMEAYEFSGKLVPLGEFHAAEFFISPSDFDWTMIHTHEDHEWGGPYFIRREWS